MIYLVRHGESVGNAGGRTDTTDENPLTETGWRQARDFALRFVGKPDLIVHSPYLRAKQTAQPLMERFPDVPVEVWPVQEFTYLDEDLCRGTTQAERQKMAGEYIAKNDADLVCGKGAESYNQMLKRADDALERFRKIDKNKLVVVFTHGIFVRAMRLRLAGRDANTPIRELFAMENLDNAGMLKITL